MVTIIEGQFHWGGRISQTKEKSVKIFEEEEIPFIFLIKYKLILLKQSQSKVQ